VFGLPGLGQGKPADDVAFLRDVGNLMTDPFTAGTATSIARIMGALAGPVSRWWFARKANSLQNQILELADGMAERSAERSEALWEKLRVEADLETSELFSARKTLDGPLMDPLVQMTVVQAILQGPGGREGREVVRQGIAVALSIDTELDSATRAKIATVVESEYFTTAKELFQRLVRTDVAKANILHDSAVAARTTLQMEPKALSKRIDSLGTLNPVVLADMGAGCSAYSEALANQLRTISVPTPTRELPVDLTQAFIPAGLKRVDAEPDRVGAALLDALGDDSGILIFGNPGSGKSTNVQFAMLQLAESSAAGSLDAVPFRVVIRNYASSAPRDKLPAIADHICDSIRREFDVDIDGNSLRYLLQAGRAVVFLDGLDEVLDVGLRREVVSRISSLTGSYPASSYVVTSRFTGYDEAPLRERDRYALYQTRPFFDSEIEDYAGWFFANHGISPYRRELGVAGFMRQTQIVKDVRSNPLMLGVLCGLYATGRTIPANRTEVYSECSQMLFEQWDRLKDTYTRLVDQEIAERAIGELAHYVLRSGTEEITMSDLAEFLSRVYESELDCSPRTAMKKATETIDLWRGRRWVLALDGRRDDEEIYRFSHRTFLEYFAAEHLAYTIADGRELFDELKDWIVRSVATPYDQLAVQLTSRRRADDGELFLDAALEYLEVSDSGSVSERLSCASFLAESLASLRLKQGRSRVMAVTRIVRVLAQWLPHTVDIDRFFDSEQYAYADFRTLSERESTLADASWVSPGIRNDDDEQDRSDVEVTFAGIAKVFLRMDNGREVGDGGLGGPLAAATQLVVGEFEPSTRVRFILFFRCIAEIEGSRSFATSTWLAYLRGLGEDLLNDLPSVEDFDWDDSWVVVQLAALGIIDVSAAVRALSWWELFVGGSPYPVVDRFTSGVVAHHIVREIIFGVDRERAIRVSLDVVGLLNTPTRETEPVGRDVSDLFVFFDGEIGESSDVVALDVSMIVGLASLLLSLEQLGDRRFVDRIVGQLGQGGPLPSLALKCLDFLRDPEDEEVWQEAASLADACGVGGKELFEPLFAAASKLTSWFVRPRNRIYTG
jgi:hypothetical protein